MRETPPKTIDLVGHRVTIQIVPDGHITGGVFGSYDEGAQLIVLAEAGADVMRETALHEVVHGVEQAAGLGLDETQVHAIARNLYQVGKANPGLIAWLWGER